MWDSDRKWERAIKKDEKGMMIITVKKTERMREWALKTEMREGHGLSAIWEGLGRAVVSGWCFSRSLDRRADPWGLHAWCAGEWTASTLLHLSPRMHLRTNLSPVNIHTNFETGAKLFEPTSFILILIDKKKKKK